MKVTKVTITATDPEIISVPDGVNKEDSQKSLEEEIKNIKETFFIVGEKPIVESALELFMAKFESDDDITIDVDFSDDNNLYVINSNKNYGVSRVRLRVEY